MSTVGMMDGTFFVSRSELMRWANSTFHLNLSKIEQCANGAVYCQVIDACHPNSVTMKKVNWSARADHEAIPNFKVLQQAFDKNSITRHIEVDKLIRGKYQDNLEMLQWIKTYFDRNYQGGEYDAQSRRYTDHPPEWSRSTDSSGNAQFAPSSRTNDSRSSAQPSGGARQPLRTNRREAQEAASHGQRPTGGHQSQGAGRRVAEAENEAFKEEYEKLREEIVDLKITVDGLETERDFYFQKLRDIEILSQALEAAPNPDMTVAKFVEDVQRILYAKDDEEDGLQDAFWIFTRYTADKFWAIRKHGHRALWQVMME